jgi:HSP20 family protein
MANISKPVIPVMKPFFDDFFDFDPFFRRSVGEASGFKFPAVNIAENEREFEIQMAVPGFKKEDMKIRVEKDVLMIEAETKMEKEEEQKNYTRKEYSHQSFSRQFKLPDGVKEDAIEARFADGILSMKLPKSETQAVVSKEVSIR